VAIYQRFTVSLWLLVEISIESIGLCLKFGSTRIPVIPMLRLLIFFAGLFALKCVNGQYATPTLLTTAGGDTVLTQLDLDIAWSFGEAVILTMDGQQNMLTNGFHQSDEFCAGDFNFDGVINIGDLLVLLADLGCMNNCIADLNNDVATGIGDLLIFLSVFGTSCYGSI